MFKPKESQGEDLRKKLNELIDAYNKLDDRVSRIERSVKI
jgi:uncharacterized protein YdcH (DUF465 family)